MPLEKPFPVKLTAKQVKALKGMSRDTTLKYGTLMRLGQAYFLEVFGKKPAEEILKLYVEYTQKGVMRADGRLRDNKKDGSED